MGAIILISSDKIAARFSVDDSGRVFSNFRDYPEMVKFIHEIAKGVSREDASASIQEVLERTMLCSIARLLERTKARHLGVAGGVFANVKLNRLLAEQLPIDEIFIFPAMGDEGMSAGGALCYLLQRDGLAHWLSQRRRLQDVYFGRDYTNSIDKGMDEYAEIRRTTEPPVEGVAKRLNAGQLGAIYIGRMEHGPRALGARSILANPSRRETHDLLNKRLSRSEFMPFAPVITAEKAAIVFDVGPVKGLCLPFYDHHLQCEARMAQAYCGGRPCGWFGTSTDHRARNKYALLRYSQRVRARKRSSGPRQYKL
jgi:carbamoyltransferase